MLDRALENPTPSLFREDGLQNVAAATDTTRTGLLRKQAVDMEMFWGKYVKDQRLLSMLCSEFRQYTVEILLWVPFNAPELFEKEVAWDSYFSNLEGFDACSALNQARIDARQHQPNWPKPTWPKDVEECLECVVPAARVAEVAAWFAPFTVEDLFAMDDAVILQLLILQGDGLTFPPRFLYRYLQAAREYHRSDSQYTDDQRAILKSARKKFTAVGEFRSSMSHKLARAPKTEDNFWEAFRDLVLLSFNDPTFYDYWELRQKKYNKLPWHDVDVSDTVSGLH